jgi:putative transposase
VHSSLARNAGLGRTSGIAVCLSAGSEARDGSGIAAAPMKARLAASYAARTDASFEPAGEREVLACAVGDTETETFWTDTFRDLRARGLAGVRLVISDHHEGLKNAIAKCFVGAGWQRCRVHYAEQRIMPSWVREPLWDKDLVLVKSA